MKKFNITVYDIEKEHTVANASREAEQLWKWGMDGEYKKLTDEELMKQLDEFGRNLMNASCLQLIADKPSNIPTDCYIDLALKPTYVAASTYIYAYNKHPEWFKSGRYLVWLCLLLNKAFSRKLLDHGYEAEEGKLMNLELFASCGMKKFIAKHPNACGNFAEFMQKEFAALKYAVRKAHSKGKQFTVRGFESLDRDEQAMRILAAVA